MDDLITNNAVGSTFEAFLRLDGTRAHLNRALVPNYSETPGTWFARLIMGHNLVYVRRQEFLSDSNNPGDRWKL